MRAVFKTVAPYGADALDLPVRDVEAAIPYYERTFGFRVVSRQSSPYQAVVLARDDIQIGLAENGGDPTQEGCYFEVSDIEAAFAEINGTPPPPDAIKSQKVNGTPHRVFFHIAPDGLCYMLGQREE